MGEFVGCVPSLRGPHHLPSYQTADLRNGAVLEDSERTLQLPVDVVTSIEDTALPFDGQTYQFVYDDEVRLKKLIHPEGYFEEYSYDANDGKLLARKDIDGGVTEYTYDETKRLEKITDPWGNFAEYSLYGQEEENGPFGALKDISYSNGTKTEYAYDSQNRLDVLTNVASDESEMSLFDYNYDLNGNVERIALVDDDVWAYEYDPLNRLTMEKRLDGSNQERWHREYDFDPVGNRETLDWWDGSNSNDTTYTYNDLNQLYYSHNPDNIEEYYDYDWNGNLSYTEDGFFLFSYYDWTIDDRLSRVENSHGVTEYSYDYKGARIMRTQDEDNSVKRYFFNGITEEVVKQAVPGAESADAFKFTEKENGESASDWYAYAGPSGTMTSVSDESHRSNVIELEGGTGTKFIIGDNEISSINPNAGPWHGEERALSFWFKGDWNIMTIFVEESVDDFTMLCYHNGSGTNSYSNSVAHFYLGANYESTSWQRLERNIEADYNSISGNGDWLWTNGLGIEFGSGDTDFLIDDIKVSNSMTKEFNALNGGSTGQIIAQYAFTNGAPQKTVTWLNYDRLGNVRGNSDTSGAALSYPDMDAYGNVLSSMTTGAWASTFSGRHLTTKEYDPDAEMYYFSQRWQSLKSAIFVSKAPHPPMVEHPYSFVKGNPGLFIDPNGEYCGCLIAVGLVGAAAGAITFFCLVYAEHCETLMHEYKYHNGPYPGWLCEHLVLFGHIPTTCNVCEEKAGTNPPGLAPDPTPIPTVMPAPMPTPDV